jgi:hypothetical protein
MCVKSQVLSHFEVQNSKWVQIIRYPNQSSSHVVNSVIIRLLPFHLFKLKLMKKSQTCPTCEVYSKICHVLFSMCF